MRIAIFGTVGAGKTTLIQNIHALEPDYEIFWEPLQKNPYFSQLYTTKEQVQDITYKMEIWMLAARMRQLKESYGKKNTLFDRGVMDTIVFADTNHQLGKIDDRDWGVYSDYFEVSMVPSLFTKTRPAYDLVIYLRVSDETSTNRIKQRGIKEEQEVDPKFWNRLNQTYDKWYNQLKDKVPFYVLDGDKDNSSELAREVVNYIKSK
ncbi:deoxynucleoside kinase [Mesoplasma lactucae]|uniref:Deoxyguanosine kinase n=1 Tax=Mesoplasma lactucae ATCC 49193 TaxID=81460 RepID=A0A291IRE7_9MOLU|nr:deoxynucleoside kinase [Mesoplasma lactucae]ATG97442.1 deoxyguanosine kinase [Mesoplasma lactucae ATCC 49193]ATZ20103.1 deoxynucleoside kinase [Mesoplasma lactucae ATCC 49193]MCL8216851.1 Deoxyadenosine kinase [Mesoplasma lactucae ATCC 49193]